MQLIAVKISLSNGECSEIFGCTSDQTSYQKYTLHNLHKPKKMQMDCRAACFAIRLENTEGETMFQWQEPRSDQRWKSIEIPQNHVIVGVYGSKGTAKTITGQGNSIERFSFITANSEPEVLDITAPTTIPVAESKVLTYEEARE